MARAVVTVETEERKGAVDKPPAWLAPGVLAAGALYVALFVYVLIAGAVLKPYSDEYAFLSDAYEWRDGAVSFPSYLWHPHVGHHAVWVRLLTAWESAQVGGAWPTVACASVALGLCGVLVGWVAWWDARLSSLRLPVALVCGLLVLTGFNALDADQPINALYPLCVLPALASLWLFEAFRGAKAQVAARIAALVLAMAAALGNGAALALWPVLALAAATHPHRRWLWTALVLAVGAAFSVAYLSGAQEVANLGGAGAVEGGAGRRLLYLLDFLALPWSQLSSLAGAVLGLVVLAAAGMGAERARRRGLVASERLAIGFILFALGAAVLATAGRGGVGEILRAPMRYALFVAPLHAGILMLWAPDAQRWLTERRLLPIAVVAVFAGLILQQVATVPLTAKSTGRIRAVIADYERGLRTPEMTPLIYPQLDFADRIEARLKAERHFGKAPSELAAPASAQPRTP